MHKVNFVPFAVIIFIMFSRSTIGQEKDSVKNYLLDEITIKSGIVLEPKTITEISLNEIEKSDAGSIIELGKYIPSLKTQTNSRGESLFYLRGSGERQLTLFFDGVPLNIPWDNRIDLSLIPTESTGEIFITKGIPSIVYGANNPAGVISINSKEYSDTGPIKKLSAQIGENNSQRFTGVWLDGMNNFSYMFSLSYNTSDGYSLPADYNNSANPGDIRNNSYKKGLNAFAKAKYNFNQLSEIDLSVSYIDAEKGVPPETDVENPRYWQYPDWRKLTFILSGSHSFTKSNNSILAYSFSATAFNMQINQYKDISFTTFDDIEKDKDAVYYGRLLYTKFLGLNSLIKLSLSGYNTVHKEKFLSDNYTEQLYSQNVYSAGVEYEYMIENLSATIGVSLDGTTTPHTGDKPSQPGKTDYSLNAALVYSIDQNISFQFNAGRKTRFPSLRETFSGALGRFVPNPGLKPEAITGGEWSIDYLDKDVNAYASFFLNYTKNGIVRQSLPGKQFQRINKDEIRNLGIETKVDYKIDNDLSLNFNFTYLNSFAKNNNGDFADTLEYQPKYIGGLNIDYTFLNRFNGIFEINYVGEEYGLQEGNTYFQQLPDYLLFNFRLAYNFKIARNVDSQIYVRVNNIFDKLYYTQWSLPEPGRQLWGGLSIDF